MTELFYHVDRDDTLAPGETLELHAVDEQFPGDNGGLEDLYPEGFSSHGRHYCSQDLYEENSDNLWDVSCELIFELVRVAQFPDRPSRFQSVFAFRALRDAERFVDRFVDDPYTIWRVAAEESFTADMRLVDAENYVHGIAQAQTYWRGSTARDDPLWEELLPPPVDVVELVTD